MSSPIDIRKNLKRKLNEDDGLSGAGNAKRILRSSTEATFLNCVTKSPKPNLLKSQSAEHAYSVGEKQKQNQPNERYDFRRITRQNSQAQINIKNSAPFQQNRSFVSSIASATSIASDVNSTSCHSQNDSVLSSTSPIISQGSKNYHVNARVDSVLSSISPIIAQGGKNYSANARLQSLRNKINKDTARSVSSGLPLVASNSKSTIQHRLMRSDVREDNEPVPNKRNFFQKPSAPIRQCSRIPPAQGKLFQPFQPFTNRSGKSKCLSVCEDAATVFDDSESAFEFGKTDNDSDLFLQNDVSRSGNIPCTQNLDSSCVLASLNLTNHDNFDHLNKQLVASQSSCNDTDCPSTPDYSIHGNSEAEESNKIRSFEEHIKCSAITNFPSLINNVSNQTKSHNSSATQSAFGGYSANDRLTNLRHTLFNKNTNGLLTSSITKSTNNFVLSKSTEPTNNGSFKANNPWYCQNEDVTPSFCYYGKFRNESQVNQSSPLSQRLSNIRNFTPRRSAGILDKPQSNEAIFMNKSNPETPSVNFLPSKKHGTLESIPLGFRNMSDTESRADEEMEWSIIDESEALSDLQVLRKTFLEKQEITHVPQTTFQKSIAKTSPEMTCNLTILKGLYVVVDTNIFISHLQTVKEVLGIKVNGVETPVIMIPWMVIQELDYIKDGRPVNKLQQKAQEAIRFINHKLSYNDPFVKGQSVIDAAKQEFSSANADDSILHCCLQIIKNHNRATLLSNDINLRNKALLNNIPAYGHDRIISALYPKNPKTLVTYVSPEDERIKKMKSYLSLAWSNIISDILQDDCGLMCKQIIPTDLPWPLEKCVDLLKKYWLPVFSKRLNKQCGKLIDNFGQYLETKHGHIPIEDANHLMDFGYGICVYFKNCLPKFKAVIDLCIDNMQDIDLK